MDKGRNHPGQSGASGAHKQHLVKGTPMLIAGYCCWSCFLISQAVILKSYPAKLSLTALICTMGTVEGTILAFAVIGSIVIVIGNNNNNDQPQSKPDGPVAWTDQRMATINDHTETPDPEFISIDANRVES
ncbi:hypothetical protein CRYUN_Cryun05aG0165400 [Craigia yunnanensis]